MIERLIAFSIRQRFLVVLALVLVTAWGIWAVAKTPLDAIPDLSDNQVIVFTDWSGRSPQVVEDQITYPLASGLQGLPGVRAVRAQSALGFSMIYVIFEDAIDPYWARTRVLERLATVKNQLPEGVSPALGPDGTGVGHVYWYVLRSDKHDLGTLRAVQDFYLKLRLQAVPGVAEIASVGGYMKQYQVDVDPEKLRAYGVSLAEVAGALRQSNNEVGGNVVEWNDAEYAVRGLGYVKGLPDLEQVVVKTTPGGTPVTLARLGTVQLGSDLRRGLLDLDGQGEVVGGIVVMRSGENAQAVIERVKAALEALAPGLPEGVRVESAYDRSELIERAVSTLEHSLVEEAVAVSAVIFLFLLHARSALVIVLSIPVAVLISFIAIKHLGLTSNLMSLGGVAIAIGVLVDAGIVMVENAYRHLADRTAREGPLDAATRTEVILASAQQVGRPIFFSLVIIVLSFLPIFMLTGQEGKLFHPLAATKTFAMVGAAVLSITLVPMLMTVFLKGRLRPEHENPVARFCRWLYEPVLKLALRFKAATLALAALLLVLAVPLGLSQGKEFMPSLDEGSLLYMPVTVPDITVTEAKRLLQVQDKILSGFPEVERVLGKVGRAESATDPAPVSMFETIITLKPKSAWRPGMTKAKLVAEMDAALQIPGVANGWTQPIINRINMLATGVRTDLGLKIYGPDLETLERLAVEAEGILKGVPGAADVFAERVIGGRFVDVEPDRQAAARYGVNVGNLQAILETAVGGQVLTTTVEGRERFAVRLRYARDGRSDLSSLERVYVPTPAGPTVPLAQLAKVSLSEGPPMINSENSLLRSVVFLNVRGRDMGGFVAEAQQAIAAELALPPGYSVGWSGQYENQVRAGRTLQVVVPLVLLVVFVLLYWTFQSFTSAALILLSVPFALVGGVALQALLGYNFSVAVWVGYIALVGIAVETGVVMLIYLNEALDAKLASGPVGPAEIEQATWEGAALRLRPKLMTVAAALIGLVPLMLATGTGSDLMRPLATPMVGGLVTSTVLVLIVLPVLFALQKRFELRQGKLKPSGVRH